MYTPMDFVNKSISEIKSDIERIAKELGPCDLVLADVESGTDDDKILELVAICKNISKDDLP